MLQKLQKRTEPVSSVKIMTVDEVYDLNNKVKPVTHDSPQPSQPTNSEVKQNEIETASHFLQKEGSSRLLQVPQLTSSAASHSDEVLILCSVQNRILRSLMEVMKQLRVSTHSSLRFRISVFRKLL